MNVQLSFSCGSDSGTQQLIAELNGIIESLQQENKALRQQVHQRDEKIGKLRKAYSQELAALQKKAKQPRGNQKQKTDPQLAALQKKAALVPSLRQTILEKDAKVRKVREGYRDVISGLQKGIQYRDARIARLNQENTRLKTGLDQHKKLEKQHAIDQQQLSAVNRRCTKLEKKIKQLQITVDNQGRLIEFARQKTVIPQQSYQAGVGLTH